MPSLIGNCGSRPLSGTNRAPKLPVALAATSMAAFQRVGSIAADAKASAVGDKSPNALAIERPPPRQQRSNRQARPNCRMSAPAMVNMPLFAGFSSE